MKLFQTLPILKSTLLWFNTLLFPAVTEKMKKG